MKELNEEILKRLDGLTTKLGISAEHLWGILTKQAKLEFIMPFITFIIFVSIATLVIVKRKYLLEISRDDEFIEFLFGFVAIATFLGSIIFGLYTLGCISYLFNPEYFAFQEITKLIGG